MLGPCLSCSHAVGNFSQNVKVTTFNVFWLVFNRTLSIYVVYFCLDQLDYMLFYWSWINIIMCEKGLWRKGVDRKGLMLRQFQWDFYLVLTGEFSIIAIAIILQIRQR